MPINMSAFATKLTQAAWRSRPSWAAIASEDKAFDARMLQDMARRIGAKVTNIKASHALYFTQPVAVADVIESAANGAK